MSGYRQDFSRSNNAHEAYREGRVPKSAITTEALREAGCKSLTASAVRKLIDAGYITTSEWHHSGKYFTCVDFFDLDCIAYDEEGFLEMLKSLEKKEDEVFFVQGTITLTSFSRSRGRFVPVFDTVSGAFKIKKGKMLRIESADGSIFTKKENNAEINADSISEETFKSLAEKIKNEKIKAERAAKRAKNKAEKEAKKAEQERRERFLASCANGNIQSALAQWANDGFYHPAPSEVMEYKINSGLSWSALVQNLKGQK